METCEYQFEDVEMNAFFQIQVYLLANSGTSEIRQFPIAQWKRMDLAIIKGKPPGLNDQDEAKADLLHFLGP